MPLPPVTLIAAVSEDGFISRDQGVPWHLPADIQQFRDYTAGKHLLLGRTTALEMLGWFRPEHTPIVLSSEPRSHPQLHFVTSLEEALQLAGEAAELVVCGGAQTYQTAMPWASRLLVTHVNTRLGSGKTFPLFRAEDWRATTLSSHPADPEHAHAFRIMRYERKGSPPLPLLPCT